MQRIPEATHRSRPLAPNAEHEAPGAYPPGTRAARSSMSHPLGDTHVYRPGAVMAIGVLVLPGVLTLGVATLALQLWHALPVWLPVLALLWLPAAPLAWLAMQSVRTTSNGIAVGRPWRTWLELPWEDIQHIDQRALFLRISGPSPAPQALVFAPQLLGDGGRLRREILMRLPPKALSVGLGHEAVKLVNPGDISISATGGIEGTVEAHTRARYWIGLLVTAVVLLAGTAAAFGAEVSALSSPGVVAVEVAGVLLALMCFALAAWLPQRLTLDAGGITISHALRLIPRRSFAWQRMDMIEYTPGKALLRVRGKDARAVCAGPRLVHSEQSAIAWHFIEGHCQEHSVLLIMRRRLP